MLILMRKPDQKILIGDDIEISILKVTGCQVRIGIEAPDHISIHREEIYEKIKLEDKNAINMANKLNDNGGK